MMSDTDRIEGVQGREVMLSLPEIKREMWNTAAARFTTDDTVVDSWGEEDSGRLFTSIEDNAKRKRVSFEAFMPGMFMGTETFNKLGEKVINEVTIDLNREFSIKWSGGAGLDRYEVLLDGELISLGQFDSNEEGLAKINAVWKTITEALDTIETNDSNADTQAVKDEPPSTRNKVS